MLLPDDFIFQDGHKHFQCRQGSGLQLHPGKRVFWVKSPEEMADDSIYYIQWYCCSLKWNRYHGCVPLFFALQAGRS